MPSRSAFQAAAIVAAAAFALCAALTLGLPRHALDEEDVLSLDP